MYRIEIVVASGIVYEHILLTKDSAVINNGFLVFWDRDNIRYAYNVDKIYRYTISEEKE